MSKRVATDETETNLIKKAKNPLPCEIGNMIFEHFDLHDLIVLTENVLAKAYNPNIHTHEYAIRNNDLPMIKWLFRNHEIEPSDDLIDLAAECGNLEVFKYVEKTLRNWTLRSYLDTECIEKIIQNGYFDILKHAITTTEIHWNVFIDYQHICITAAKYDQLPIVEWIINCYLPKLDIFEIMKEASCSIIHWILNNCTKSQIMGEK